jgi:hypothetical protein
MAFPPTPALGILDAPGRASLAAEVRRALGHEQAEVRDWSARPIGYVELSPVSGGLYRVSGLARLPCVPMDEATPWSLVLKIARSPAGGAFADGSPIPPGWGVEPQHPEYWKREALAYQSGVLGDLPDGLVAPRCFGVLEVPVVLGTGGQPGAGVWMWLEDVAGTPGAVWPLPRYGPAARDVGRFNGVSPHMSLSTPWLNAAWRRAWAEEAGADRLARTTSRYPDAWSHPLVRHAFPLPQAVASRLGRRAVAKRSLLAALGRLPPTLCHLDAYSRNLISRRPPGGAGGYEEQTVALDWALMGVGTVGDDLAQLVSGSLMFLDVPAADAESFWDLALAGYLEGLRDAGWRGDARLARFGAAASMAMRGGFTIPAMILDVARDLALDDERREAMERRWGHTRDELLAQWGAVASFVLDRADEAVVLLPAARGVSHEPGSRRVALHHRAPH